MTKLNIEINLVSSCTDQILTKHVDTWPGIKAFFARPFRTGSLTLKEYQSANEETRKAQKDGEGYVPCSVLDQAGRRVKENINETALMVLDIDEGISLASVAETLQQYEYFVHSTYSHSEEKAKWRVLLPLHEAIPATALPIIFDHFNAMFDGKLDASCGHDVARLYYFPACPSDAAGLFEFAENEGIFVDGRAICDVHHSTKRLAAATGSTPSKKRSMSAGDIFLIGVDEGRRNHELTIRVGRCHADGCTAAETLTRCAAWNMLNDPPLPDKELEATVTSMFKTCERRASDMAHELDVVIQKMNKKCAWVNKVGRVYRFDFDDLVPAETLRANYANTSVECSLRGQQKAVTHAEAWIRSPDRRFHQDIVFSPGEATTVRNCINLWRGWPFIAKAGDVTPWTDLLEHIFSGDREHRQWFEQWLAYPFKHPGTKMHTASVLWSARQGVGKSLIGDTVGRLYGTHFRTISAAELHGAFNGWTKGCQFVLGEENAGADHRADSNKLKHLLTGGSIMINEKHQPVLEMRNVMNFLFTSNNPDAFHLDENDRRFFIWEIKANRRDDSFYARFVEWRDSDVGLPALLHHLMNLNLVGFDPKAQAPVTEAKQEMISLSRSDCERWLKDSLDEHNVLGVFGKEIVTIDQLVAIYNHGGRARTNATALGKALRRVDSPTARRVMVNRRRCNLISLADHGKWELADNAEWEVEFVKPMPSSFHI